MRITRFLWQRLLLQQAQRVRSSSSSSSNASGTSLQAEQEEQQQQIPDVLLLLLPQWAQLQVELLLLVDDPAFKFILLVSLRDMLQLLKALQLSQQQRAWAATVQALCQPVLLHLLPHMQQYSKQKSAAIQARTASNGSALDSNLAADIDTLLYLVMLELAIGVTFLLVMVLPLQWCVIPHTAGPWHS
jgi:hypothetical protein